MKASKNNIVVLTINDVADLEHPRVTTPPDLLQEYFDFLAKSVF